MHQSGTIPQPSPHLERAFLAHHADQVSTLRDWALEAQLAIERHGDRPLQFGGPWELTCSTPLGTECAPRSFQTAVAQRTGASFFPCGYPAEGICGPIPPGVVLSAIYAPDVAGFDFNGDEWTDCEVDLIAQSKALLMANIDLVQWSICMATGNPESGGCLERHITGESNTNLSIDDDLCAKNLDAYGSLVGQKIRFCDFGGFELASDSCMWCSGDEAARECAVVDMAALLLHELTHVCGRASNDKPGVCDVSYLTENFFKIAAFARFPTASSSPCCDASKPLGLGDSGAHEASADCVQACTGAYIPPPYYPPHSPGPWDEPKGFPLPPHWGVPYWQYALEDDQDIISYGAYLQGVDKMTRPF